MRIHIESLTAPSASYGTSGLAQWIQDNVVTVVISLLPVAVLWAARAGNIGRGVTIAAGALVGVSMLGLVTGALRGGSDPACRSCLGRLTPGLARRPRATVARVAWGMAR